MKHANVLFSLVLLFFLTSCSNLVNRQFAQLDREAYNSKGDNFQQYRGYNPPPYSHQRNQNSYYPQQGQMNNNYYPRDSRQVFGQTSSQMSNQGYYQNPSQSQNSISSPNLDPGVKRQYVAPTAKKKRYTASDLEDTGNKASLWADNGSTNYLFSNSIGKKPGDILTIQVYKDLKNEISMELQRAFPKKVPFGQKTEAQNTSSESTDGDSQPQDEVLDRISAVVVEEINNDHILIRGRKSLLFRGVKRLVEVQALVPQRSVEANDTVGSTEIIEHTVTVLR